MDKVYIAGPMTGIENENREAFNGKALRILASGDIPLNPATLPAGLEQSEYMDICFAMIRAANRLEFLPGWRSSAGAIAEFAYAKKLGLKIAIPFESGCNDNVQIEI